MAMQKSHNKSGAQCCPVLGICINRLEIFIFCQDLKRIEKEAIDNSLKKKTQKQLPLLEDLKLNKSMQMPLVVKATFVAI